jgi:hypothetical protein
MCSLTEATRARAPARTLSDPAVVTSSCSQSVTIRSTSDAVLRNLPARDDPAFDLEGVSSAVIA